MLWAAVLIGALGASSCGAARPQVEVAGTTEVRDVGFVAPPATAAPATVADAPVPPAEPPAPTTPTPTTVPLAAPTVSPAPAPSLGDEALSMIHYPWAERLRGWSLEFRPARSGLRGLTMPYERRIEIYVRANDTPVGLARVVAHEIGHALDIEYNSDGDRRRWQAARGMASHVPWWPDGAGITDFDTGSGDFAEAFATWQVGSASLSRVARPPTDRDFALLAELVG